MKKLLIVFTCLIFASVSWASCLQPVEAFADGKFEVLEIKPANLSCEKFGDSKKEIKPKGCLVSLKRLDKTQKGESKNREFTILGPEGSCEYNIGHQMDLKLSSYCCMGEFTGCFKKPYPHSTAMFACQLGVWHIVDSVEIEKYREDWEIGLERSDLGVHNPDEEPSLFKKMERWFEDTFPFLYK